MPDVTPAGPLSILKDALRTLIASSSWFQTWTGTASTAAAKAHVWLGPMAPDEEPDRPFCWIDEPESPVEHPLIGTSTVGVRCTLAITMQANVSAAYNVDGRNAKVEADNTVGQFLDMLQTQNGVDLGDGTRLYLNDRRISATARFHPIPEGGDNRKLYESWDASIEVEVGHG